MQIFHSTACSGFDDFKALDITEKFTLIYYLLQKKFTNVILF